ncbi:MAG TPA: hypothetical protein DEF51_29590 [Myxococcales bacterium]|nr:hypothetical protein [Myxococcales bacterium]
MLFDQDGAGFPEVGHVEVYCFCKLLSSSAQDRGLQAVESHDARRDMRSQKRIRVHRFGQEHRGSDCCVADVRHRGVSLRAELRLRAQRDVKSLITAAAVRGVEQARKAGSTTHQKMGRVSAREDRR